MNHKDWQSVYVQYTQKNAYKKTHGGDNETKMDTNDEHSQIDEDEPPIDGDNHKLKRRRWEEKWKMREWMV